MSATSGAVPGGPRTVGIVMGCTALHYASILNRLDIVQYLVSSVCCDPLTEDNGGHTPLSWSSGETRLFLQGIIG